MPGLEPDIHVFLSSVASNTWMAGTSPAMTNTTTTFAIVLQPRMPRFRRMTARPQPSL
jgi:hypothetical protein